jgi:hypothetical protein
LITEIGTKSWRLFSLSEAGDAPRHRLSDISKADKATEMVMCDLTKILLWDLIMDASMRRNLLHTHPIYHKFTTVSHRKGFVDPNPRRYR